MREDIIKNIAARKGKTPAQILLRWGIEHNMSVIPKSTKVHRMKENIDILDFELTAEEMEEIFLAKRGKI